MQQRSQPVDDKKLTELLEEILQQAVGGKVDKQEMALIVDIAKEMLKEAKPEGISMKELKNKAPEVTDLLSKTLVAATSAAMHLNSKQIELKTLLKQHKALTSELKINPNQPEKKKQIDGVKKQIQNTMNEINRLDPNSMRRDSFKDNPNIADELEKIEKQSQDVNAAPKKDGEIPGGTDALTESLINLYGMDPRVAGSIAGPVMSVVGNEFGIPDSVVLGGSTTLPLHKLDNDVASSPQYAEHHAQHKDDVLGGLGDFTKEIEASLDMHAPDFHESPRNTMY
jgi:hypothetical protein